MTHPKRLLEEVALDVVGFRCPGVGPNGSPCGGRDYYCRTLAALREAAEAAVIEARQTWRSRMGLTVSTDAAVAAAVQQEREALRAEIQRVWNNATWGDGLELVDASKRCKQLLAWLDARSRPEEPKPEKP